MGARHSFPQDAEQLPSPICFLLPSKLAFIFILQSRLSIFRLKVILGTQMLLKLQDF